VKRAGYAFVVYGLVLAQSASGSIEHTVPPVRSSLSLPLSSPKKKAALSLKWKHRAVTSASKGSHAKQKAIPV
jgi:hypothetical protein